MLFRSVEKLKIQAEVFASIGQFLNLPSFVAIATTTISALQLNPQQAKTIGKLAAKDFRAIQTAVFKGEPPNIKPDNRLVNLANNVKPNVPPEGEREQNPKLLIYKQHFHLCLSL